MTAVTRELPEELFRWLVESMPEAVVYADRDGLIRLWNHGAETIFGYGAQEALGKTLDLIIPERWRARHWAGYREVMKTGVTRYGRDLLAVPAARKDGATISSRVLDPAPEGLGRARRGGHRDRPRRHRALAARAGAPQAPRRAGEASVLSPKFVDAARRAGLGSPSRGTVSSAQCLRRARQCLAPTRAIRAESGSVFPGWRPQSGPADWRRTSHSEH